MKRLFFILVLAVSTFAVKAAGVDTIADLIGSNPAVVGDPCVVAGYFTAGDGGGGSFNYSLGSSSPTNFGTVFSALGGRWLRDYVDPVDIRWFGALPSAPGSTNDVRFRFQEALNHADEILVTNGTYWVQVDVPGTAWTTNTLKLHDGSRLTLSTGTVVSAIPPAGYSNIYCILTTLTTNGAFATNVVLNGRGGSLVGYHFVTNFAAKSIGHGVLFNGEGIVVTNLLLSTFKTCLSVGGTNITVANVMATAGGNNTAAVTSGKSISFVDSIFNNCQREDENSPAAGIDVEPNAGETVEDISFTRCVFDGNDGIGLYIQKGAGNPPLNVSIVDCLFNGNQKHGLVAAYVIGLGITNSISTSNVLSGFNIGVTNAVAKGCVGNFNGTYGMFVPGGNNVIIRNGIFNNNTIYGVYAIDVEGLGLWTTTATGNGVEGFNINNSTYLPSATANSATAGRITVR